jgi:predicted RNA binding protein YcfA (HicA-like mRNA interferase family)
MSRHGGGINSRVLIELVKSYGYWKIRQKGSHATYTNGSKCVIIPVHKGKTIGKGLAIRITKQITHV